jgi:uncharacterized repeat protein (TIGR01451 family)
MPQASPGGLGGDCGVFLHEKPARIAVVGLHSIQILEVEMNVVGTRFAKLCSRLCATLVLTAATTAQAASLGLTPADPTLDFGSSGVISYNAATGVVTISGTPATLFQNNPFLFGSVLGTTADNESLITVQFVVDSTGAFVSGVAGPDLIVKGAVDVDFDGIPDYDGVLLEAEATQFGYSDGGALGADGFDLRLNAVTGLLAPLYAGQDLAMVIFSEISAEYPNAFNGSFVAGFTGQAKGVIGSTAPLAVASCTVDVEAYCAVGSDKMASSCRIPLAKSPKHWGYEDRATHDGKTYKRHSYGMHGLATPAWAQRQTTTSVKFKYVITNTGTTPVTGIFVDDSFDTSVAGVPASLAPGQSITLTRTEALSDKLDNTVLVSAQYLSAACSDTDTVVVKEKLRDKRRHDDDKYKEKDDDKDRR